MKTRNPIAKGDGQRKRKAGPHQDKRRKELLNRKGYPFLVDPSQFQTVIPCKHCNGLGYVAVRHESRERRTISPKEMDPPSFLEY